jgi:hypothetical protein
MEQIGLLNVSAGLNLPTDAIYPLLIVASVDRWFCFCHLDWNDIPLAVESEIKIHC